MNNFKIYRVYDLEGNLLCEGKTPEVKGFAGMKQSNALSNYTTGLHFYKHKYLIIDKAYSEELEQTITVKGHIDKVLRRRRKGKNV